MLFQTYKLLSTDVAKIEPFLKNTACMAKEYREMYAYCEIYMEVNPEDKEFNEFLKKMQKAIQKLGMANWERTELSDLGLKRGEKGKGGSLKGLRS